MSLILFGVSNRDSSLLKSSKLVDFVCIISMPNYYCEAYSFLGSPISFRAMIAVDNGAHSDPVSIEITTRNAECFCLSQFHS